MGPGPQARPVQIDLDRRRELRIRWADGAQTVIALVELRRGCPCAACRAQREALASNPLTVLPSAGRPEELAVAEAIEPVGHYAVRLRWRDGHETGIYDYRLLRSLGKTTGPA